MAGSNLNHWLSTKKRGRDDEEIEQAREDALAARRKKMPPKTKTAPKRPAVKSKLKAKQVKVAKKKQKWSDDDDYEEEDDDVVEYEDSEEEEEDEFAEEEEESEGDNDDDMASLHDSSGDDLSETNDPKTSSFFPKGRNKTYKVKPMLAQVKKQKAANKAKGGPRAKKKRASVLEVNDSDDDETFSDKKPAALPKTGNGMNRPIELEESSDDGGSEALFQTRSKPGSKKQTALRIGFSDEDSPMDVKAGKAALKKKLVIGDDDDNIEDSASDPADEDDQLAMALAISKSLSETSATGAKKTGKLRKKLQQKKKAPKTTGGRKSSLEDSDSDFEVIADKPKKPVYKSDPETSSDEEVEDDNDQDVFMDDEAREASQVLQTANELSASVVRIMASWASTQQGDDGDDTTPSAIPQGIIVDGAVAMGTLASNPTNQSTMNTKLPATTRTATSEHQQWISNELMKEILPNVTLSGYQLIGLNWLALLNGMTCTIQGPKGKRKTNVNGVLADEMGLGKTCQTIAFLAWLKHKRQSCKDRKFNAANGKQKTEKPAFHDNDDDDGDGMLSDDEPHADDINAVKKHKQGGTERAVVSLLDDDDDDWVNETCCTNLIVVPASVLSNWEREFARFAPQLNVIKYHGSMEERLDIQDRLRPFLRGLKVKDAPDVILTSVTYFQKEQSDDRTWLKKFSFDYMVVDEAHSLKNANSLRFRTMDRFKTKHRLLLTGTPVQNSPKELMSLLCFLMPLFNRRGQAFDADTENDGGESMLQHFVNLEGGNATTAEANASAYRKLKQLFAPFVLRRRKVDVLKNLLPKKTHEVEFLGLDSRAREVYSSILASYAERKRQKATVTDHVFTQLRKAANHPLMLRTRYTSPEEIDHLATSLLNCGAFRGDACTKERVAKELEGYSDFEIHLTASEFVSAYRTSLQRYVLREDDLFCSAKFVRLRSLLPELIAEGHRILIFSVWTTCLDLLGCLLESMNLKYSRLDGQTPVEERQTLIDDFNEDETVPVMLLSTKAGGVGINLTAADRVIFHDLDFNPKNDLQAEDRCHRIGQKKDVKVIKLVALDTVDKDIYDMQERKAEMSAAIMESPEEWKKEEKQAKKIVMQAAVDRYLQSPQGRSRPDKENHQDQNVIDLSSPAEECQI